MIGTILNHYRVVRQLGRGGMGEVYEAEDTKLHRKVALKVLPTTVAADAERRERFEREARAVAALNHPGIVTIHSVEEADGVPFLTMELVEGTTLADLIPPAGLPIDKLLATAIPIADAIAAAQQRGITHRDLKPANVMVTASGQVKVLDFGLAKRRDMEAGADAEGATKLATTGLTGEGRIVGTVAYMSPEQAEGRPVDSRSDIFSLGVMLHQMATGEQPFRGDTPVSVISSIIKDTPSAVTALRPSLPPDLARIIKRCLAKEPERRYQTALDLRNELEELRTGLQSGEMAASGVRAAPAPSRRTGMAAAGTIIVLVAIVAAWLAWSRGRPRVAAPAAAPVSLADMRMSRLTSTGNASMAAISPDGKYVVHVVRQGGLQSLWIRQTTTTSNVQIVPPADVRYDGVTVSPDATYVYYSAYEGSQAFSALYQVPVLGGTPRKILEDIDSPVSFSPDGSEFVFVRGIIDPPGAQLLVARADGTGARVLATTTNAGTEMFQLERPSWSPDGRWVAVAYISPRRGGAAGVTVIDVASGKDEPLGEPVWQGMTEVAWLADGSGVLASATENGAINGQIWRIAYPGGRATRVTNDLASYAGVSLSADSRALVTVQAETVSNLWVMPAGDTAAAHQITAGVGQQDLGNAWTPDGRIVYASNASGNVDVWIAAADGTDARQLTVEPAIDAQPRVCGGGRFIVFTSLRTGSPQIWRMALDGSEPVKLSNGAVDFLPVCAPDANEVVYTSQAPDGRYGVWRVPLDGGTPVMARELQTQTLAISPDGHLIAGPYIEGQRQSVAVAALDSNDPPRTLPIFPRWLVWSPDGRALTYVDVKEGVANIWRQPLPSGTPTQLTAFTSDTIYSFAWSLDGKQLALSRGSTSTDVVLLTTEK
jgi:Tol biopolymer transport system component